MAAPTVPTVAEVHVLSGLSVSAQLSGTAWHVPNTATQLNPAQYDTVVAFVTTSSDVTAVSTPTGWREVFNVVQAGTAAQLRGRTHVFKRTMSAADVGSTANHTWTVTRAGNTWVNVSLVAVRGANSFSLGEDLGATFGVYRQFTAPDTATTGPSTSTFTLPAADNLLMFHAVANQGGSSVDALIELTPPASMTKVNFYSATLYQTYGTYTQAVTGATPGTTTYPAKTATFQHASLAAYSGRNIAVLVDAPANALPTVSAGADQSVASGSTVTLTGTASDPFGSIDDSLWAQTAGPAVTINEIPGTYQAQITGGVPGTATLRFGAVDNDGGYAEDFMSLTVTNTAPVAYAGGDRTAIGGTSVTITDATATDTTVGDTLTYAWSQVSGPAVTSINNGTTLSPTVTFANTTGTVVLRLTVTDSHAATDTDDVSVAVTAATVNPVSVPTVVIGQVVLPNSVATVRSVAVVQNASAAGEVQFVRRLLLAHGTTDTWTRGGLNPDLVFETQDQTDVAPVAAWNFTQESNLAGVEVVRDYYPPANRPRLYQARSVSQVPGEPVLSSDPSEQVSATLALATWVFKHPSDHTLDVSIQATREPLEVTTRVDRAVMQAFGRRNPIESVGDEHGEVFALTAQFWTQVEFDRFKALFRSKAPVLVQPPGQEREWWATFPDAFPEVLTPTVDISSAPFRTVTVTLTEADRP